MGRAAEDMREINVRGRTKEPSTYILYLYSIRRKERIRAHEKKDMASWRLVMGIWAASKALIIRARVWRRKPKPVRAKEYFLGVSFLERR